MLFELARHPRHFPSSRLNSLAEERENNLERLLKTWNSTKVIYWISSVKNCMHIKSACVWEHFEKSNKNGLHRLKAPHRLSAWKNVWIFITDNLLVLLKGWFPMRRRTRNSRSIYIQVHRLEWKDKRKLKDRVEMNSAEIKDW